MGYTHGKKWSESEIIKGILGVKDALGTEYMPCHFIKQSQLGIGETSKYDIYKEAEWLVNTKIY